VRRGGDSSRAAAVRAARRAGRRKGVVRSGCAAYSRTIEAWTTPSPPKETLMTSPLTPRIAAFALAALMTLGMLGSIDGFAKVETRRGAANPLVALSTIPGHPA
jgi:hypothetical protein